MNPLKTLSELGQSPWLDFIQRSLIGPKLDKLLTEDGVGGITSNPSIFEKAIGHSTEYDEQFTATLSGGDAGAGELFETLAIRDIQQAADHLRPIYERTKRRDGYISLEVSPYLANDTDGTIAEARRLWKTVDRPNLMVKVPGTAAGVPAIETLIGDGININVTLLFAQGVYIKVAEAFIAGLEKFAATSDDLGRVNSVASFFVSRIDTLIDGEIDKKLKDGSGNQAALEAVKGKVAVANAKLAYQHYKRLFSSPRWQALAAKGAFTQRLLWASTGTKNPAYSDVLYVDTLIGADTVNTMPPATMDAFRDHGTAKITIEDDLDGARTVMAGLEAGGISMDDVAHRLVEAGVKLFAEAADSLLGVVAAKRVKFLGDRLNSQAAALPAPLKDAVDHELDAWRAGGKIRKLWAKDAALWTGADEAKWLGWLDIVPRVQAQLPALEALAAEAKRYDHVLLLGMGGSSLGPEVLAETFGRVPGHPELLVLDSTDPTQIKTFENRIDVTKTLFIVSSKSGSTLEPNIFKQYFFELAKAKLGAAEAGKRFVAVTDPGSKMQHVAEADGFGHVFFGDPAIGGRYSVLSAFGIVPAAAAGIDVRRLLDTTQIAVRSAGPAVPPSANSALQLGAIFGVAGTHGRDKITIIAGAGARRFRRLGGAAHRRIDRQDRQGADSRRCRGRGRPRRLWRRPGLRLSDARRPPRRFGSQGRGARSGRQSGRAHRPQGPVPARPGVLPLGDRHRRRRIDHRHRPVRPARCRGRPRSRPASSLPPMRKPASCPTIRRSSRRTDSSSSPIRAISRSCATGPGKPASRASSKRISRGSRRATMPPSSPISRARRPPSIRCSTSASASATSARSRPSWARAALPALDRPGLQGRAEQRRVPADHLRRPGRPCRAGPEIRLLDRQGGAGPRRFRRAGRARPARVAHPSGQGSRGRSRPAGEPDRHAV